MARIAYLSSDVIVSVQPAQGIESEFSVHLHRYAGRKDRSLVAATDNGVPEVRESISTVVTQAHVSPRLDSNHQTQ